VIRHCQFFDSKTHRVSLRAPLNKGPYTSGGYQVGRAIGVSQMCRSVPQPAFWGRRDPSGDYVVEGLYDALVECRKHLLQVTACHDQLAESGVVCLA
jgi:hypothetical protein